MFLGWRNGRLARLTAGARNGRGWELAALRFLRDARREAARASRASRRALRVEKSRSRATRKDATAARPRRRTRAPTRPVTAVPAALQAPAPA